MTIELEPLTRPLSPAELDVLELASRGLSNQAIARRLFLSASTVESRLTSIYDKWDLNSRAESNSRVTAVLNYLGSLGNRPAREY